MDQELMTGDVLAFLFSHMIRQAGLSRSLAAAVAAAAAVLNLAGQLLARNGSSRSPATRLRQWVPDPKLMRMNHYGEVSECALLRILLLLYFYNKYTDLRNKYTVFFIYQISHSSI